MAISDGPPLVSMVYMNLQPPAGTARRSPAGWWSLTHAFSPLPGTHGAGGRSLLPSPAVANCFHFPKWSALCCPDFPPASPSQATPAAEPGQCFRAAKVLKKRLSANKRHNFLLPNSKLSDRIVAKCAVNLNYLWTLLSPTASLDLSLNYSWALLLPTA